MKPQECPATQTCRTCQQDKPLIDFRKGRKDCKACSAQALKAWKQVNREKIKEYQARYNEANQERIAAKHKDWQARNPDAVRKHNAAYRETHKAAITLRNKDYYQSNKDVIKVKTAKYREERPEQCQDYRDKWIADNPEANLEAKAKYRAANREALREKNQQYAEANADKIAAKNKAYRQANPGLYAEAQRRRSAASLQATPAWADRDAIIAMYEQAQQMSKDTGIRHEVDHKVPLQGRQVCGLHVADNLQIIPARINRKKSNKHDGWMI